MNEINQEKFVKRLKETLAQAGISHGELARMLDLDPSTVSRCIGNLRTPSEYFIAGAAYHLNVNPEYLKGLSEDRTVPDNLTELYTELAVNKEMMETDSNNIFGARLKKAMDRIGMRQFELAQKADFAQGVISNYKTGKRRPDIDSINTLCDILGVSSDYLLGRVDNFTEVSRCKDAEVRNPELKELDDKKMKKFKELLEIVRMDDNDNSILKAVKEKSRNEVVRLIENASGESILNAFIDHSK